MLDYPMYQELDKLIDDGRASPAVRQYALTLRKAKETFNERTAMKKVQQSPVQEILSEEDLQDSPESYETFLLRLVDLDDEVARLSQEYIGLYSSEVEKKLLAALQAATDARE